MSNRTETTLRAVVDGKNLERVKLPAPVRLKSDEAYAFAAWARHISGVCLTDIDVMVSDVRPSSGLKILCDLDERIAKRIRPLFESAEIYGFGLRLSRESNADPYELAIIRRVVDAPQLTISEKSMSHFFKALRLVFEAGEATRGGDRTITIEAFADMLANHYSDCMDAGVAHYASYAQRIVEYGRANGATELVCGPERRGAVEE